MTAKSTGFGMSLARAYAVLPRIFLAFGLTGMTLPGYDCNAENIACPIFPFVRDAPMTAMRFGVKNGRKVPLFMSVF